MKEFTLTIRSPEESEVISTLDEIPPVDGFHVAGMQYCPDHKIALIIAVETTEPLDSDAVRCVVDSLRQMAWTLATGITPAGQHLIQQDPDERYKDA